MTRSRNILFLILAMAFWLPSYAQEENLSLSDALSRSLKNNYGLIIARADADIASINNNWGTAGRYPTLGFDASDNNSYDLRDESYINRFSAGIGLNWTLFDGFRVSHTKSRLENLEEMSEGRLGVMVENTIEDLTLAYYNVLLQKEQLQVLRKVMDLSEDRYRYELEAKSLGGSVTYQVLQAQNLFLADKANFMNQEVVVRNAVRNMNFIMGESPEKSWTFTESFVADTSQYNLGDLLEKMRSDNQSLKNQYTNLLLKENEISLARAAYSPSLSLGAGIDLSQSWLAEPDIPTVNSGSLSPYGNLRLSFDIYSAGTRRRAVEIARINEESAKVEIREMDHALTNELYNLFDYYQVRIALLNVAGENLAAAELNLTISEEKYRSGVINSFNYRDIQLIYLNAAVKRLQAIYNLVYSRTQLTRITGGFLSSSGISE